MEYSRVTIFVNVLCTRSVWVKATVIVLSCSLVMVTCGCGTQIVLNCVKVDTRGTKIVLICVMAGCVTPTKLSSVVVDS